MFAPPADRLMQNSGYYPGGHSEVPVWEPSDFNLGNHATDSLDSADLGQMMTDLFDGATGMTNYSPEWLNWGHQGLTEETDTMPQ
jgi:hypothetical protein